MTDGFTRRHRVTCVLHEHLHSRMVGLLSEAGVGPVYMETGRTVRQQRTNRRFGLPGSIVRLAGAAVGIYRFNADPPFSGALMGRITDEFELNHPGRGTIYAQEIKEYITPPPGQILRGVTEVSSASPLRSLALLTFILSMKDAGDALARTALSLGTGVPTITLGLGTGIRDRLGLLRITVSPEKQLLHLLVSSLDAEGIMSLLVDEGRLNRPGRGFAFCSPVLSGHLDTRLRIGYQEHSASMGQIIAAIDEIKAGTAWRRRLPGTPVRPSVALHRHYTLIYLTGMEESTSVYVEAAMDSGALGATNARMRRIETDGSPGGARETCIMAVPEGAASGVITAVLKAGELHSEKPESLFCLPAPLIYSYRR